MITDPTNIRLGVVGVGPHFRETLLSALLAQDNVMLTAFCDNTSEATQWVAARFPGAVITDQVTDVEFWGAIDCVICCSWPRIHEQVLVLAIEYGKHCFCEKPATSSASALDHILREQLNNLVIRVGHAFRYMGGGARFIDIVSQQPQACLEITYLGSGPRASRWAMSPRKSFSLTHLTHAVDFVTAAAGNVLHVENVIWSSSSDTDSVVATFNTEWCRLACLFATNAATAFTCKATSVLTSGALVHLDGLRNVTLTGQSIAEKRSGQIWRERDLGVNPQNDGYMDELRDFFAEIRGTGHCRLPDLTHARHVLAVIEEIGGLD